MGWREDYDDGQKGVVTPFWKKSQWTALGEQDREKDAGGSGPAAGGGALAFFLVLWWIFGNHADQSTTPPPATIEQSAPDAKSDSDSSVAPSSPDTAPSDNPPPDVTPQTLVTSAPPAVSNESPFQALADDSGCQIPTAPAAIDGSTATKAQMETSLDDVRAFIRDSDRYQGCLSRFAEDHRSRKDDVLDATKENQAEKERIGRAFNDAARAFNARGEAQAENTPAAN